MGSDSASYYVYRTPYGSLTIRVNNRGVTNALFGKVSLIGQQKPSTLSNETATQFLQYFAGKRSSFDVPLDPSGSDFQRAVWNEIRNIPYAETRSSTDIARALGKPQSYRSVGAALKKNPLMVIVPTQRVVGFNGQEHGALEQTRLLKALFAFEQNHRKTV